MARTSRLKIASVISAGLAASVTAAPVVPDVPATPADVPPVPATGGDVPAAAVINGDAALDMIADAALGATIDPSVVAAQPSAPVVEPPKASRAKKEPSEPRPATVAEMMAQSLRNHQEYTDRAAAIAELEKQLKNL